MSHRAAAPGRAPDAAVVATVVQSLACHFCDDADRALTELAENYPLVLDRVDIRSDRGRALVAAHRSPMSPLVLLDGTFFSAGRLPRRKLEAALEQRLGRRSPALDRSSRVG